MLYDFRNNEIFSEMKTKATTKHVTKYLAQIKKARGEDTLFVCGYEAGPTGYGLCRGLQKKDTRVS